MLSNKYFLVSFFLLQISWAIAQTPSQATCDSVRTQIEQYAERHVGNSSPMQTGTLIILFKNSPCFTEQQIATIYEEKYDELQKANSGLGKKLIPNAGWVIAILLLLFLAFKNMLSNVLTNFFHAIAKALYNKFAGSRVFRGVTVKKYKRALYEKYKKLNIAFRPSRPLNMCDVYIPLKYVNGDEKNELDVLETIKEHKRSVIIGAPGSGKSMLCKNVAYNFGNNNFDKKLIPVVFELHRLNASDAAVLPALAEELGRNNFPNSESFIQHHLRNGQLFLLFDGFDEVNTPERKRVSQLLKDFFDTYKQTPFIVTCRTAVYQNEFAGYVNKTLELAEFNSHQIRQFLQAWEVDMPAEKSIDQLMLTLQDRPQIMAIAINPLMLTIIAYLYTDTPHILPHSRGEFYQIATDVLLKQWHQDRNNFTSVEKSAILQHLALVNQDEEADENSDRKVIKHTKVLEEIRKVLPSLNLKPEQDRDILSEIVERSGLLLSVDGGEYYQFSHLTMQEFFAAKHLLDNEAGLLQRFEKDNDAWRESVRLWCGLTNDATSLVREVFTNDKVLAFECLAEARKIDADQANIIIEHFSKLLSTIGQGKDNIAKAFGSVASDTKPRGQAFFNFLSQRLAQSNDREEIAFIIKSLSYTYLPKAAKLLAEYYGQYDEAHEALLRMGDIAVPWLAVLAGKGEGKALKCLKEIDTPDAALAMLPFIWWNHQQATLAAFYLSELITQSNIEDVLRQHPLSIEEKRQPKLDWVWRPFNEPLNSSLPTIMGRICYLIRYADDDTLSQILVKIDPRVAIPMCTIEYPITFDVYNQTQEQQELFQSLLGEKIRDDRHSRAEKHYSKLLDTPMISDIQEVIRRAKKEPEKKRIQSVFYQVYKKDRLFSLILQTSTPDLALELIKVNFRGSTKARSQDWLNIFNRISFDFDNSWHYRFILIVYGLLTLSGLGYLGYMISKVDRFTLWHIFQIAAGVIVIIYAIRFYFTSGIDMINHEDPTSFLMAAIISPIGTFLTLSEWKDTDADSRFAMLYIFWPFVVFYYNTLLLNSLFGLGLLLSIWLGLLIVCIALAVWGTYLDRKARNPLFSMVFFVKKTESTSIKPRKKNFPR